jgi:hypothetical protein
VLELVELDPVVSEVPDAPVAPVLPDIDPLVLEVVVDSVLVAGLLVLLELDVLGVALGVVLEVLGSLLQPASASVRAATTTVR